MPDIASNLHTVLRRIHGAAVACKRAPEDIQLLAVSKTFPSGHIRLAYEAGQRAFGENYVDEALDKIHTLSDLDIEWHFIGPIQSNKTRKIAENFHWVHSISSEKIARRLNDQRPDNLPPLNVCIQVNISGELSKSGITPDMTFELANYILSLPRLKLRGIMGIPAKTTDSSKQHQSFHALADIFTQIAKTGAKIDTLSMGMTADMEPAIAEGATIVRIGTAIFGVRDTNK